MSRKRQWVLRFAADMDLGVLTVAQAHDQMERLQEELKDAGFPTIEFQAMLAPLPTVTRKKET